LIMSSENRRTIIPSVENGYVVLTIPKGDAEYKDGKVYRFKTFAPTDLIQLPNGEKVFPNKDGITAAGLLAMTPDAIVELAAKFEDALRVIDDLEQLREKVTALVIGMAPDSYEGPIRLEFAALGMNKIKGNIVVPTSETIRVPGFAFEGIEYRSFFGKYAKYTMAIDNQGKFNYSREGILYIRVNGN
jgi:hypothetical protein